MHCWDKGSHRNLLCFFYRPSNPVTVPAPDVAVQLSTLFRVEYMTNRAPILSMHLLMTTGVGGIEQMTDKLPLAQGIEFDL